MNTQDVIERFVQGEPRLHYLEWNSDALPCIVLLHGSSANAWWWQPFAKAVRKQVRLIALDQRGHGDSGWVRPPAYSPTDYAADVGRLIETIGGEPPVLAGHSMGGISALAYAAAHPGSLRAVIAIDVAVTSTRGRDRFVKRLKALPTVTYPDMGTAKARFRLMPREGSIPAGTLAMIAEHSLRRAEGGGYTLKFDRESFFGSDGLDVKSAIASIRLPTLLIRAQLSRIMTAEAARCAAETNTHARLIEIPGVHHHLLLERPDLLAQVVLNFVGGLDGRHL